MRHAKKRFAGRGVSLAELLVVLAIVGVLITMVAPGWSGLVQAYRSRVAADLLFSGLVLTRSEAVKRNRRVVICSSPEGERCLASVNWEQGWIVFEDTNNNGQRDLTEAILQRQHPTGANLSISSAFASSKGYVSYLPLGRAETVDGVIQMGTFKVCIGSASPTEVRQIVINSAGRPRTKKSVEPHCP